MTNATTPPILFCGDCGWELIRITRERNTWSHQCLGCGLLYSESERCWGNLKPLDEVWATKQRIELCRLEMR